MALVSLRPASGGVGAANGALCRDLPFRNANLLFGESSGESLLFRFSSTLARKEGYGNSYSPVYIYCRNLETVSSSQSSQMIFCWLLSFQLPSTSAFRFSDLDRMLAWAKNRLRSEPANISNIVVENGLFLMVY